MADVAYAEIELGLHRWNVDSYSAELRFSQPSATPTAGDDGDVINQEIVHDVQIDIGTFRAHTLDHKAYGRRLTQSLFANPRLQTAFAVACTRAQERGAELRMRLFIGPSAPELHSLRWETLQDPRAADGALLVTSEHILFSRYLSSLGYLSGESWQRIRLRPRAELSALVVIANPRGLGDWKLEPLNTCAERERAELGFAGFDLSVLASDGQRGQATLGNIVAHVRQGCDVLYLVCHGAQKIGGTWLWLEDDDGNVARVAGDDLVASLRDAPQLPRLVVLASCQSAGEGRPDPGEAEFLHALGPRLAEIGVPAVLAMQGNFTMETARRFLPAFFAELQRDGQIDRAMAAARGAVRDRPDDSWMPVLFMRLRTGRLWYAAGFGSHEEDFKKWPSVVGSIRDEEATPILGPGLTDALLGSHREIAQGWAKASKFALAPSDQDDLPQVAQYVAINQDRKTASRDLREYMRMAVLERYGATLPPELHDAELIDLHSAVFAQHRASNPNEPNQVLARFPFPLYITTSLGNALTDALRAEGKEPQVEISRWNRASELLPTIYETEPNYRPTSKRPLVYHVFGHLAYRDTIVLTEDDYFEYLIGLSRRRSQIPPVVQRALANSALLFLGFNMNDWTFRVLLRSILKQEGDTLLKDYSHVAVQVEPEEELVLSPEGAKDYLERYFSKDAPISVYWGSVDNFAADLLRHHEVGRR